MSQEHASATEDERAAARTPTSAPAPASATRATSGGVVARARAIVAHYKRAIQAGLLALIALFIGTTLWKSWAQLNQYHWHISWPLVLAAWGLFAAQELSLGLIWRAILARLGYRLDVRVALRIYFGAESVRYIPGNVWHVIARVLWAERHGVPKPVGFASMVIELATKIASALLFFALTLLVWPDTHALAHIIPRDALITAGALAVPLLLAGLHPRLLERGLGLALHVLKRGPARVTLSYGDVLAIVGCWVLSWVVVGTGLYLAVRAIGVTPAASVALVQSQGIYALAWAIGFLTLVTPSGLGFRELALAGLLVAAGIVPAFALAMVVALVVRLLATAAELACIAGAYLAPGKAATRLALGAPPPE